MRCCVDLNPFVRCAGRHCTCALSSGCSIAKRVVEGASDAGGAGGSGKLMMMMVAVAVAALLLLLGSRWA